MARPTVPPPSAEDHEDVAWALRAASAQWRREDHADAISWVRRAAETAVEVGQAMRARDLFQLAKYLEGGPMPDSMVPASLLPASPQPGWSLPGGFLTSTPPARPVAIAPPPPTFSSNPSARPGEVEVDIAYDDDIVFDDEVLEVGGADLVEVDEVDEFVDDPEFIEEVSEVEDVIRDDELEELSHAPPPSYAPYAFSSPHSSSVPTYRAEQGGDSTRYSSAPPNALPSTSPSTGPASPHTSQFPSASEAPTRASGRGQPTRSLRPLSQRALSSRPGSRALSSRPPSSRPQSGGGVLPPLPSLGPTGGLTLRPSSRPAPEGSRRDYLLSESAPRAGDTERLGPPSSGASSFSSNAPGSWRTPSSRRSMPGSRGGGFDEAFLDSLEDPSGPQQADRSASPPATADGADLDFLRGDDADGSDELPSVPDLPAPRSSGRVSGDERRTTTSPLHGMAPEPQIRASGSTDSDHGDTLSPTPGRVSVRPTSLGLGEPPLTSGVQPFALAPSASLPPVAAIEPPSSPSKAPPPESMSEPEYAREAEAKTFDLSGEILGDSVTSSRPPLVVEEEEDILAGAFERLQSIAPLQERSDPPSRQASPKSSLPPVDPNVVGTVVDGVDLLEVHGLQDLPEEAACALAARARVISLAQGEEVSDFGVALVTAGAVQLMPTIANAACALARTGEVLFTQGAMPSNLSLRVVGAQPGSRVAVFSERDLEIATSSCPWVADELAEVADRFNAFGGAVLGPMGESLDEMFRMMVFEKCSVKNPPAGSLIAEEGKPMDGMYVLGAGTLEVVSPTGSVTARLSPGDFVFPETILSAGPASATVRVPPAGALVLYADRMSAHELLATCPPFIELLAGN